MCLFVSCIRLFLSSSFPLHLSSRLPLIFFFVPFLSPFYSSLSLSLPRPLFFLFFPNSPSPSSSFLFFPSSSPLAFFLSFFCSHIIPLTLSLYLFFLFVILPSSPYLLLALLRSSLFFPPSILCSFAFIPFFLSSFALFQFPLLLPLLLILLKFLNHLPLSSFLTSFHL
jgi:hypothetical protein